VRVLDTLVIPTCVIKFTIIYNNNEWTKYYSFPETLNNKVVLNVVTKEEIFLTHETECRSVQVVILKHICPVFGDNEIFLFNA